MAQQNEFRECDECLCFAARRAARAITQVYDQELRSSGLRATQFTLLSYLLNAGRRPMNQAADYMGLERTTLTRNLQPLLALDYITVDEGEDRRVKLIGITPAGRAAMTAALPHWRKAQRVMSARLSPTAVRALAQVAEAA
jgi:DNA-binding MarR family transcriptional regulator